MMKDGMGLHGWMEEMREGISDEKKRRRNNMSKIIWGNSG